MQNECPYCEGELDEAALYEASDYRVSFEYICPHCKREMHIEVELDPIYYPEKIVPKEARGEHRHTDTP
jgi:DNA-directed RNA polymerase subunit RPC12/RpoP